jgi:predicted nucleic acid-binding protein
VSFTDCTSFVLMQAHRLTQVFTFDRHFDGPGFSRIPLAR